MYGIIKDKIYYKKEKESQKLLMGGGSWTINLSEIKNSEIEKFIYITPDGQYSIDYQTAMQRGFIRILGGELKLIVPLVLWRKE